MNWVLWVVQMISLMGYEERGRVTTPEHFAKGKMEVLNCTVAPTDKVVEFNQHLLVMSGPVLNSRRFALQHYPPPIWDQRTTSSKLPPRYLNASLYDGFAKSVGDWMSIPSDIEVRCSADMANFTTVFQVDKIDINYTYSCEREEGHLRVTVFRPTMDIVLLQGRNSKVAYTYGCYPPSVIHTDFYLHPKPQNHLCQKSFEYMAKYVIPRDAYIAIYYGIKEVLDVSGDEQINLQKIIKWNNSKA